jgi:hypothetical protein
MLSIYSNSRLLEIIDYKKCPNLPPLSESDITYMRNSLSRNKAITYDGFSEEWFLKTKRIDLISDIWRGDCLKLMPYLG